MRRVLVTIAAAALAILPLGPASAGEGATDDVCAVVEDLLGYGWCESED